MVNADRATLETTDFAALPPRGHDGPPRGPGDGARDGAEPHAAQEAALAIAVMSGHDTEGRWRISGQTNAIAVMGGCDLDLRYAEIEGPGS